MPGTVLETGHFQSCFHLPFNKFDELGPNFLFKIKKQKIFTSLSFDKTNCY